jgi:hypothetical protein
LKDNLRYVYIIFTNETEHENNMLLLENVRTPYSHPDSYDANWRWGAAQHITNLEDDEILSILDRLDDDYLMYAVAYQRIQNNGSMLELFQSLYALGVLKEDPRAFVAEAHRIYEDSRVMASATAAYIEALLLCFDITDLQVISDRLPVSLGGVEAYEKIFYNCRTPDDMPVKASLRVHFALGGGLSLPPGVDDAKYWKYTGAIHGSDLLYNEWGWCMEEDGIPVVAIAKSLQQVTLNNARKTSATGETPRQATAVMLEVTHRMLEDHAQGELDKDQREVIKLISGVAPTMDEVTDDDLLAVEDQVLSRLAELEKSQESKKDQAAEGNAARIMAQLEARDK